MFAYLGKVLKTEIKKNKDTNQNVLIATVETTKGNNRTCEVYYDSNVESRPVKDDLLIVFPFANSQGNLLAVGARSNIIPTKNEGEYRVISRNASGTVKATFDLLNDKTFEFNEGSDFACRFDELKTQLDQLKQDFNNHMTLYTTHKHTGVQTGSGTSGNPDNPGVNTNVDFTQVKVSQIKVPTYAEEIAP